MSMRSSWGLILDLGDTNSPPESIDDQRVEHVLYHQFWDSYGPPVFEMGTHHGIPQGAEGKVILENIQGKAYTKIEKDTIGYPPGWEVPTLFSLSLFGFDVNLPDNQILVDFLFTYLKQSQQKGIDFRMAAIGNMGSYYLNIEMINAEWVTLQQQDIFALVLINEHPLSRELSGTPLGEHHTLLTQNQLKVLWTTDDFEVRHKRYKQAISKQMHTELLPLLWERPDSN